MPDMYKSSFDCAKNVFQKEGFRGFYQGLLPPLTAQFFINAICFGGESISHKTLAKYLNEVGQEPSVLNSFFSGSFAGFLQCCVLVPTDIIKCRLQISAVSLNQRKYSGVIDCVRDVYGSEGVRGLYRGLAPTLLREVPSFGLYFLTYKFSRQVFCSIPIPYGEAGAQRPMLSASASTLLAGGCAGASSWILAYPIDVIKSNVQTAALGSATSKKKIAFVAKDLYRKHGLAIFYRGIGLVVLRAFPVNAATFFFYEYFKTLLNVDI